MLVPTKWNEQAKERQRARRAARSPEKRAADNAASATRFRTALKTIERRADPEYKKQKLERQGIRRLSRPAINGAIRSLFNSDDEYYELYDKLFKEQKGLCKICSKPPGRTRFHMDHCHTTLIVRGLLCYSCNTKLGFVEKFAVQIARYLK